MTTSPQPTGLTIMVIDDSSTIRRSAEIFLTQAGYQVVLATASMRWPRSTTAIPHWCSAIS